MLVPSAENLSPLIAAGFENVNCAIVSGCAAEDEDGYGDEAEVADGVSTSEARSTTVMLHPAGDTGDVGGGGTGNELGVTVAWESNTPSTGERRLRLRLRSAAVWYSCGGACVAAGALFEKNMPSAPAAEPAPDEVVDVLRPWPWLWLWVRVGDACACSPDTAAVTPARAAENAIPPRVFIPLKTLPPILSAALPRSAWVMPMPGSANLDADADASGAAEIALKTCTSACEGV